VRILELSELSERLGEQVPVLHWLDGDPPVDLAAIRRRRRLGYPSSDYEMLLAEERGQLLGKVEATVQPYLTPAGTESVVWVSGVATRPDAVRRGVARALLREVHARERSAGRHWAFLWTHRPWVAHQLYEELGYRDVYAPPSTLRYVPRSPRRGLPRGYGWRTALPTEHDVLERVLSAASTGRHGFIPRYPGSFRLRFKMGWRRSADFRLLVRGSEFVGYALAPSTRSARTVYEAVVTHPRHAPAMLDELERETAGRWLAFTRTTFITDHAGLLRSRGYAVYRHAHPTLMARPLRSDARGRHSGDPSVVCKTPAFQFNTGDTF
jgi:GNAT superfamily N-acetyltransferase